MNMRIYFEKNNQRTLIAERNDRQELIKAGYKYLQDLGYTPNPYWSYWTGPQGEEYMDFGSWSAYLVIEV